MNSDALLKSQGWRGKGFSLDQSDRGLSKPLLVKHKLDSAGLGSRQQDFGNQWWLKAWDKPVQNSEAERASSPVHSLGNPRLYSSFVKGKPLTGSLESEAPIHPLSIETPKSALTNYTSSPPQTTVMASDLTQISAVKEEGRTSSKKRKLAEEEDHTTAEASEKKKSKKSKNKHGEKSAENEASRLHDAADVATGTTANGDSPSHKISETGAQAYENGAKPKNEKKKKLRAKDIRAERKKARQEKAKANALRKRASQAATGANHIPLEQKESKVPKPRHPESIAALRARGERVELPDPPLPPKDTRVWFTADNLPAPNMPDYVHQKILADAEKYNAKHAGQNPLLNGDKPRKKKSYKADKYERERIKRQMKREWKHWQEVRQNPEDYRPDGTYITDRDRGIIHDRPKKSSDDQSDSTAGATPNEKAPRAEKKKKSKEVKRLSEEEKLARRKLKEEMKVQRRVARKMVRAEKKRKNHEAMQAHISAKLKAKKREEEEKIAKEQGLTWEEWDQKNRDEKYAARLEKKKQLAAAAGLTLEEFEAQRPVKERIPTKQLEKEARSLGLSLEEYANQAADPDDSELGSGVDAEGGLKDGTYQHFGRSPIDRLWAKHMAEKNSNEAEAQDNIVKDPQNADENDDVDSESSSETSSDESDSESSSDGGIPMKEDKKDEPISSKTESAQNADNKVIPASKAEDFIPLDAGDESGGVAFMIDEKGDASLALANQKRRVKDLTKEERKARLEEMRKRRAERAEASGVTKMSKKERRKKRQQRKEELLLKMTQDIVRQRKEGLRPRYNGNATALPGVPEPPYEPLPPPEPHPDGKKVKDRRSAESKSQFKQARREARRIMRNMKKGKLADHEIPEGWEHLPRRKTPKLRGNGGRIPQRVLR